MKRLAAISLLAALCACGRGEKEEKVDGTELYALMCADCHNPGPGHPGTMLLEQLGRPVPSLIGRKDLELDYVRSVVRQGLVEMPPFRPTELSDAQIEEIYNHIMSVKAPPQQAPAVPARQEP